VAALWQMDAAPEVILLTSWLVLLWRHTGQTGIGQTELALGVACGGRQDDDLAQVYGPLTQTLPLRADLAATTAFSALLRQVEQTWYTLTDWQDYFPVDQAPDLAGWPVGFEFVTLPAAMTAAGVEFTLEHQWVYDSQPGLRLTARQRDAQLILEFHYNEATIGATAIAALGTQMQTLLTHISAQPTAPISSFSLLSETARQDHIKGYSRFAPTITPETCIHHRFEQQAAQSPQTLAVIVEDQQLTYQELNTRANQLAHYLQQLGAGPEVPVAMYLGRSPELLITLLAILKTGSAYLPLDPALPTSGVNLRLQDAQAPILVTRQSLLGDTVIATQHIVCLERDREVLTQQSATNPTPTVTPANLAYVIYTSGSTGQPKGVAVEHRQLLTYVDSIIDRLDLSANAHYATVSTIAADLGHTMIFPCFCQGGTLHLITAERAADAQALVSYVEQHPIDCLKIVPSHLKALLQTPNVQRLLPRQRLVLGGEVCPWSLIEQIQRAAPDCRVFNHYGPTETTVGVLTYEVTAEALTQQPAVTVPLGQAIANSQIYLLDPELAPVPMGIAGEVYVGGDSVTRGYLQQPGLTAARFMPDLFRSRPGARMYRTGDLARHLPDGNLEFLRRVDSQVKLHGFRIELGEIETQLALHPGIQAVSALVREDDPDNPLLVAYVVLQTETAPNSPDLRQFLQQRLPNYMIPSLFVPLPALPLTPNGKVDRRALPAPERIRPELAKQYVAPRNATEEVVAAIWAEVLGLEQVGVDDDFFEVGGHSLLATQVLSRLRETFQVELPLRQLFEAHTVAEIVVVIEAALLAEIEAMTDEAAQALIESAG
ncbi:MAG: amino acid adenylation domain-containing protein, partial [Cyanobacteria bacterium J06659_2]